MERLLVLMLESGGCAAEAQINGLPVASLPAAGGRTCVAVHEYTLAGRNQLAVVAAPQAPAMLGKPAQPRIAVAPTWIRASLVLCRQGHAASDPNVRVLANVEWAATEGKPYEAPTVTARDVELPVNFPRWRWLDAPPVVVTPQLARQVLEFIQLLAVELGHGNPDPLLAASKLRFDELAVAYQRDPRVLQQAVRDHLQKLFEAKALAVMPPLAEELVLRPLADGRLIECLSPLGAPALRTQNDDPVKGNHAWPIRLAVVDTRIYVLR